MEKRKVVVEEKVVDFDKWLDQPLPANVWYVADCDDGLVMLVCYYEERRKAA